MRVTSCVVPLRREVGTREVPTFYLSTATYVSYPTVSTSKFGAPSAVETAASLYRSTEEFQRRNRDGEIRRGAVRYQRISADPFIDVSFIEGEIKRIRRFNL